MQNYKQLECEIFKVYWNMLAVVFHCFFNLRGCTFKDSVSPVLVFQKTSFKCFRNQGILVIEFTISQTILYFAGIFMLNGKQLLNKTNTQTFPKKYLFALRIIRVFINVWMKMMVLLPKFIMTVQGWNELKNS